MKNQKGVSMITLIITIIVIIILAAIAFLAAGDQVGSGQFAGFSSEFGDYANNFINSPYADVTEGLGLAGKASNKAQKLYAAARGLDLAQFDAVLNGVTTPGGYKFGNEEKSFTAPKILDATGAEYTADLFDVCYEIADGVMAEYPAGHEFYGDANGVESHWVTKNGLVFTLPGFPRTVDGQDRMYITADLYYVPTAGAMLVGDENHMTEVDPVKVAGDVVTGGQKAENAMGATYTVANDVVTATPDPDPAG